MVSQIYCSCDMTSSYRHPQVKRLGWVGGGGGLLLCNLPEQGDDFGDNVHFFPRMQVKGEDCLTSIVSLALIVKTRATMALRYQDTAWMSLCKSE